MSAHHLRGGRARSKQKQPRLRCGMTGKECANGKLRTLLRTQFSEARPGAPHILGSGSESARLFGEAIEGRLDRLGSEGFRGCAGVDAVERGLVLDELLDLLVGDVAAERKHAA